jgi:hypothetical protein
MTNFGFNFHYSGISTQHEEEEEEEEEEDHEASKNLLFNSEFAGFLRPKSRLQNEY